MKILIQKISLFTVLVFSALLSNAQTIEVSALSQVIANGSTIDASLFIPDLNPLLPVTLSITNKGTAPLILTKSGGKYVTLGNTGATDFIIDESALTGTIAPGKSQTFSVALNTATATNGTKTVSMTILNNDILPANKTYVGSIKYTLASVVTSIVKASDIGLSLFPNPSNDGHFSVKADNIDVDRIVVSNVNGITEEFTSKEFSTHLKGLLLIQVYTSKGLVSEKVLVQ